MGNSQPSKTANAMGSSSGPVLPREEIASEVRAGNKSDPKESVGEKLTTNKKRSKKRIVKSKSSASKIKLRPEELDYKSLQDFYTSIASVAKFNIQFSRNLGRDIVRLELVGISKKCGDITNKPSIELSSSSDAFHPSHTNSLLGIFKTIIGSTEAGSIALLPNLHTLDLRANADLANGTLAFTMLSELLRKRKSITSLDVSGCPVGSANVGSTNIKNLGASTRIDYSEVIMAFGTESDGDSDTEFKDQDEEMYKSVYRFRDFVSAAFDGNGVLQILRLQESQITDDDLSALIEVISTLRTTLEKQAYRSEVDAQQRLRSSSQASNSDPPTTDVIDMVSSQRHLLSRSNSALHSSSGSGSIQMADLPSPFLHSLDLSRNSLTEASLGLLKSHLVLNKQEQLIETASNKLQSSSSGREPKASAVVDNGANLVQRANSTSSLNLLDNLLDERPDVKSDSFVPAFLGIRSFHIHGNHLTIRASANLAMLLPSINKPAGGASSSPNHRIATLKCFNFGCGLKSRWKDPPVNSLRKLAQLFITASQNREVNDLSTSQSLISELLRAVPSIPFRVIVDAIRDLATHEARKTIRKQYSVSSGVSSASEAEERGSFSNLKTNSGTLESHNHLPIFYCIKHRQVLLLEELLSHKEFAKTIVCNVWKRAQVRTSGGEAFVGSVSLPLDGFLVDAESMSIALKKVTDSKKSKKKSRKKSRESTQKLNHDDAKVENLRNTHLPTKVNIKNSKLAEIFLFRRPMRRNYLGQTALHFALRSENLKLIRMILRQNTLRQAEVRKTGYSKSTLKKSLKLGLYESMSKHVQSTDTTATSMFKLWMKSDEFVDQLKPVNSDNNESIHQQVSNKSNTKITHLPTVLTLNGQRPDMCGVNEREIATGLPPLRIACRLGLEQIVNELLDLGADVRSAALTRPCWESNGCNALHEACVNGMNRYAIQILEQAAIAVDANGLSLPALCVDNLGRSPLMFCLFKRNLALAKANLLSLTGGLHKDSRKNKAAGTKVLLELRDDFNRDTLSLVVQWQGWESTRLILRAGAKALLELPGKDDGEQSLSTTQSHKHGMCCSLLPISSGIKSLLQKCLHGNLINFFWLDTNWVADRLIHVDRLSPYGCALLRHEQALRHLDRDKGNGRAESHKSDSNSCDDEKSIKQLAEITSIDDLESGSVNVSNTIIPKRRRSLLRMASSKSTSGNDKRKRQAKPVETLSQAQKQVAKWALMRLKTESKLSNDESFDVIDHQLTGREGEEGDESNSSEAFATSDGAQIDSVKTVTPFEREKVAQEILRAFDNDLEVKALRRTSALLQVRREAVSYTFYVMILVGISIFLTVGKLADPAQNDAFMRAASDKVVDQDSPRLPPPDRTFLSLQSIDHFWAWMEDCVIENLFPLPQNQSNVDVISDTELHLPDGVLDGGAMIILNGMVRMRQIRRKNLFGEGKMCDESGNDAIYPNLWKPRYENSRSGDNKTSSTAAPPVICVRTDYSESDFIDDPDSVFLGTKYTSGDDNMEVAFPSYSTTNTWYPPGGFVFDLFTSDPMSTRDQIMHLKHSRFIDAQTAAIFVTYAMYNVNLRSIAVVRTLVEFTPGGARLPSFSTTLIRTERLFSSSSSDSSASTFTAVREAISVETGKVVAEIFLGLCALYYLLIEFNELAGIVSGGTTSRQKKSKIDWIIHFCKPHKWRWREYCSKGWNFVDLASACVILVYCGLQIQVHVLKANLQGDLRDPGVWSNILRTSWYTSIADDTLATGFLLCGLKLFKVIGLVPASAGRVFEAIMGTIVAPRVLVLLGFLLLCIIIFGLTFFAMYGSSGAEGYITLLSSIFSTISNMLGDGDLESQTGANFIMGHVLWFICVAALSVVLLNIFIAIVSVEYERLEDAVIKSYEKRIDERLAQLVRSRLKYALQIGVSKTKARKVWNGFKNGTGKIVNDGQVIDDENKTNTAILHAFHPVDWSNPPLASSAAVLSSKADLFEEQASLSDQISSIAVLLRKVAEDQQKKAT